MFLEITIILVLILLNGFFSLSEIALVSSKITRLEQYRQTGSKGATIAIQLLQDSERFLSAVQVGITLISIITGFYGGTNIAKHFSPLLEKVSFLYPYADEIALVLTIFIITYISIVFGELVPKTLALSNPEKVAVKISPSISLFSKIFYPFVRLLSGSTAFVNKMLGIEKQTEHLTESELRHMIKLASQEGVIEKEQNEIHEKVFYFSDKKAKHLMTHRTEVYWIDLNDTEEVIRKELTESPHSKVVCCLESLDKVEGIVFLKDFYKALAEQKTFKVEDLITPAIVIHENTLAPKVLEQLRQSNSHFSIVVDEYGDVEGIISLHDIMESLVGYILDEGEVNEPDYLIRDDNSVLVNGDAPIEVLTGIFEDFVVDFEEIDYSTVAGFVIELFSEIPSLGDNIKYMDYTIEIMDMDGNRIDKVLIYKK
ncbi:MAG: hemolysin family protein [Paludibacteraceae bacterium]